LRFDDFAMDPEQELTKLVDALNLPIDRGLIPQACAHVVRPESLGRHRGHDLAHFSSEQLDFCRAAGWPIG
jgi:hypothetical protein